MVEENESQALDRIDNDVDEHHIQLIQATACYKAQAVLFGNMKEELKRTKEKCNSTISANAKLQFEITNAEQQIKSLQIAEETIRRANVELKKQWLLANDRKLEITERVQRGEKKYEDKWLECKSGFESRPFVQKLLKAKATAESLKRQTTALDKKADALGKEIQAKREACINVDKKRIIQLAEFMKHERPKLIIKVNEKSKAIADFTNQLKGLYINMVTKTRVLVTAATVEESKVTGTINDNQNMDKNSLIMPKLQLDTLNLDDLISVKLDQVKMKKVDYAAGLGRKESFNKSYFDLGTSIFNEKNAIDQTISSYFSKPSAANEESKTLNYSSKKLITILEDVHIDETDAMNIISKVNPDTLQSVQSISAEDKTKEDAGVSKKTVKEPIQTDEIEEVNMTCSNAENILKPPTQFLDATLNTQKTQDLKQSVSFDLPASQTDVICENTNKTDGLMQSGVMEANELDVGDDGYKKIKDMVLKKHNLDLSPSFVYAKNTMLQMKSDDKITSKFFKSNGINDETDDKQKESTEIKPDKTVINAAVAEIRSPKENARKILELDVEADMMVTSPKQQKIDEASKPDNPFSGYLFRNGAGPAESPNVSMDTTGYEEGDVDFPQCLDSSLLLSPKADFPMDSDNPEEQSLETPNFLGGLRKTGFSFFGSMPGDDSKPDSKPATRGRSGFNFNFGGEAKKNRGGFFNLFQ